jgi:hypothetical protein
MPLQTLPPEIRPHTELSVQESCWEGQVGSLPWDWLQPKVSIANAYVPTTTFY